MNYRTLGKTGYKVSEVSLGTWQVGGRWGADFDQKNAEAIIHKAIDEGVNFIDTADVYGDGLSEKIVGAVVRSRSEEVLVATKSGRRLNPHNAEGYNSKTIESFIDDSLKNSGLDTLDLLQLHCPPTSVYQKDEVFEALDKIKEKGKIRHYGVSVEKVEEAIMAMNYSGVATVQIIFNMFRPKPAEEFFPLAKANNVGILARVPLASGLLSGKITKETTFASEDHRNFNRDGKFFDKGETFSGVPLELGFAALERVQKLFGETLIAPQALKWVLMFDAVSCVIPGASRPSQAEANISVSNLPDLTAAQMEEVQKIYDELLKDSIHPNW
ncbi:aldo/keto reductase [Flammeovirgaceae bacterium SG7u.111]|nr:aldo/keto reductase [Flammeovirgaceae bacterium SG7u.132]WPO37058.1 aldo/keto reductase [Flammeovirgaceae bacterium SG7u.111]